MINLKKNCGLFLSHIKNSCNRKHLKVKIPVNNTNLKLITFLYFEGYFSGFLKKMINNLKKKKLYIFLVFLKYHKEKKPIISKFKLYSKGKKNVYKTVKELKKNFIKGNLIVISTNFGLLSLDKCFLWNVSGKLLFILI